MTPFNMHTVGRIWHQRTQAMMARLYCVSTSLLAAGGCDNSVIDEPFGGTYLAQYQDRNTRSALPPITTQMRKFVHAGPIPDGDMLLINVTLKKEDYGVVGSLDYCKNTAMAMAGLTKKFGASHHKIVAGGEESYQSRSAHVQQVIMSIIHFVKEDHQQSKAKPWTSWKYAASPSSEGTSQAICLLTGGVAPRSTCGLTGIFAFMSRFRDGSLV